MKSAGITQFANVLDLVNLEFFLQKTQKGCFVFYCRKLELLFIELSCKFLRDK